MKSNKVFRATPSLRSVNARERRRWALQVRDAIQQFSTAIEEELVRRFPVQSGSAIPDPF